MEQQEEANGRRFGRHNDAVLEGLPERTARSQTFAMHKEELATWGMRTVDEIERLMYKAQLVGIGVIITQESDEV